MLEIFLWNSQDSVLVKMLYREPAADETGPKLWKVRADSLDLGGGP